MSQHPEYLYWLALVVFGVPAIIVARSIVPVLVIACSVADALFWRAWPSPQAEGVMLAVLYGSMFLSTLALRLDAAETMAAALWSPMVFCALAQAAGADPVASFWVIYWLAMAQATCFVGAGRWPLRIWRSVTSRFAVRGGGYRLCPA